MAPVFAEVSRDAVAAHLRYDLRGTHGIGMIAPTCISNGSHMVDVDAQPQRA
jgi:hypothetical protein